MTESSDAQALDDITEPFVSDAPPGHQTDEDGNHAPEECYQCLLTQNPTQSNCRCGKCCHLIIEVEVEDAEREPRIKEIGSPIYSDARLTASGQRELIGYMLNSADKDCACAFLERQSGHCSIYETRPLICRLFDCDGDGRTQLVELGYIQREDDETKPAEGQ